MRVTLAIILVLLGYVNSYSQDTKNMSLEDVVNRAWRESNTAKLALENIKYARDRVILEKTNLYPDVNISGKYLYLNKAKIHIKKETEEGPSESEASAPIHNLFLGQAGLSIPLFSGFKIRENIKTVKAQEQSESLNKTTTKEELAMQAVNLYISLYEVFQNIEVIQKSLESTHQRVIDFQNMKENGLLALNDLLKAKLQESDVKLELSAAQKKALKINFQLITFLKLPKGTKIIPDDLSLLPFISVNKNQINIEEKASIQALKNEEKALSHQVKSVKSNYFPSLGLSAGYLAFNLQNTITVHKAFNIGLGLSYNFADIFKNKSAVRMAQSKKKQLHFQLEEAKDEAEIERKNAIEDYQLSLERHNLIEEASEQAKENYRIVKDKFDSGLLNTRDLLEADEMKMKREIKLAEAKGEIFRQYYQLKKSRGQLIEEFETSKQ